MKTKLVDILLVMIITLSVAVIGYSYLHPQNPTTNGMYNIQAQNQALEVTRPTKLEIEEAPQLSNRPSPMFGTKPQKLLLSIPSVSDADWQRLKQSPELAPYLGQSTAVCSDPNYAREIALKLNVREAAKRIQSGELQFIIDLRAARCINVGETLIVLSFSQEQDEPFVSQHGAVTITDILEIPFGKIPKTLWTTLNLDSQKTSMLVPDADQRVVVVRYKKVSSPPFPENKPPAAFTNYRTARVSEIKTLLHSKRFVLVDVRSEKERAALQIANAVGIPLQVPGQPSDGQPTFSWKLSSGQLSTAKFDTPALIRVTDEQQGRDTPLLVFGSSDEDGRPFWALRELFSIGFSDVVWYVDGATSLESALNN